MLWPPAVMGDEHYARRRFARTRFPILMRASAAKKWLQSSSVFRVQNKRMDRVVLRAASWKSGSAWEQPLHFDNYFFFMRDLYYQNMG